MAIDPCVGDGVTEGVSLEGAPATLAHDLGCIYRVWGIGTHEHEVGLIAFADESAALYLIKYGWVVCHLLY